MGTSDVVNLLDRKFIGENDFTGNVNDADNGIGNEPRDDYKYCIKLMKLIFL